MCEVCTLQRENRGQDPNFLCKVSHERQFLTLKAIGDDPLQFTLQRKNSLYIDDMISYFICTSKEMHIFSKHFPGTPEHFNFVKWVLTNQGLSKSVTLR